MPRDVALTDSIRSTLAGLPGAVRRRLPVRAVLRAPAVPPMTFIIEEGALARRLERDDDPLLIEVLGVGTQLSTKDVACRAAGHDWSLTALVPTVLLQIPTPTLQTLCLTNSAVCEALTTAKEQRIGALLARLVMLRERSPARRVAETLLYLMDALGQPCPIAGGSRLSLTQGLIASAVDLTRQTTNRELRRLVQNRIVHIERGMVCVLDGAALRAIAAGGQLAEPTDSRPTTCQLVRPGVAVDCAPVVLRRA